ncbi:MAG: leucine zipper domain-containing protein [Gemmatimonadota bacterium]
MDRRRHAECAGGPPWRDWICPYNCRPICTDKSAPRQGDVTSGRAEGPALSRSRPSWSCRHHNRQLPEDSVNVHKKARLTTAGRSLAVRRVLAGERVPTVARGCSVSPRTIWKWVRRCREAGALTTLDWSSRPHRVRQLPRHQRRQILRARHQRWSPSALPSTIGSRSPPSSPCSGAMASIASRASAQPGPSSATSADGPAPWSTSM